MKNKIILTILFTVIIFTIIYFVSKKNIYTEIIINSSQEKIFNILKDIDSYPEWNPYHVIVKGKLKLGEELIVTIHKPNNQELTIKPKVISLVQNKSIVWGGGFEPIFKGEHSFILEKIDISQTRLIHKEYFHGIVIPFLNLETIEQGYNLMNEALKIRCEK